MPKKPYKFTEDADTPLTVNEPAFAYEVANTKVSSSEKWNPNVPFHCTQEEFLEHIHSIEQGNFTPWEEAKKELEAWRKERLARY
ncbi:MAG: hypothetical protein FWD02_05740 [Bacteroidales bacterium]|nr:hypothetical protein [Bacteroidales bacterium]